MALIDKTPKNLVTATGWYEENQVRFKIHIKDLSIDLGGYLSGEGLDRSGSYKISGSLKIDGSVKFRKKYSTGQLSSFKGQLSGTTISGVWKSGNTSGKGNFRLDITGELWSGFLVKEKLRRRIGLNLHFRDSNVYALDEDGEGFFVLRGIFNKQNGKLLLEKIYPGKPSFEFVGKISGGSYVGHWEWRGREGTFELHRKNFGELGVQIKADKKEDIWKREGGGIHPLDLDDDDVYSGGRAEDVNLSRQIKNQKKKREYDSFEKNSYGKFGNGFEDIKNEDSDSFVEDRGEYFAVRGSVPNKKNDKQKKLKKKNKEKKQKIDLYQIYQNKYPESISANKKLEEKIESSSDLKGSKFVYKYPTMEDVITRYQGKKIKKSKKKNLKRNSKKRNKNSESSSDNGSVSSSEGSSNDRNDTRYESIYKQYNPKEYLSKIPKNDQISGLRLVDVKEKRYTRPSEKEPNYYEIDQAEAEKFSQYYREEPPKDQFPIYYRNKKENEQLDPRKYSNKGIAQNYNQNENFSFKNNKKIDGKYYSKTKNTKKKGERYLKEIRDDQKYHNNFSSQKEKNKSVKMKTGTGASHVFKEKAVVRGGNRFNHISGR